jgi:hypothetical protein
VQQRIRISGDSAAATANDSNGDEVIEDSSSTVTV